MNQSKISYYHVLSRIGAGGMGEVYLAEDSRLGRKVALKLLPAQYTKEDERLRRFEQEARAASALNHPNIITIFEVGHTDDAHFIVTEFIEGQTLRQKMASGRLSLREALRIAVQVASALSAAHAVGIVHRDIKPENIMLRPDGYVKVLDFGLVKLTEPLHSSGGFDHESETKILRTDPSVVMGTPHYMSPEQARGLTVDSRADIFSLGTVTYEMIAGRPPYDGNTPSDIIASILYREPPMLARYSREVPAELERIVTKALRKDREERYQTAKDIALDLRNLRQQLAFEELRERTLNTPGGDEYQINRGTRETVVDITQASEYASGATPRFSSGVSQRFPSGGAETYTSGEAQFARPMSSAEYIVTELRRRKRGVLFFMFAAALAVAAAYYFTGTNKKAVESIAVIPITNESGDPNSDSIADGLTESLIKNLSRMPKLKVMSLISVLRYKGKEFDPRAVGHDLNVQAVLSGTITKQGDKVRLTVELVDARDNTRIWGEQYSRNFSDMLAIQEQMIGAMSQKLELQLNSTERRQMEAYQFYLMGRNYFIKRRPDDLKKGIEFFNRAIEKNPDYALAHAGLADCYSQLVVYGAMSPQEAFPEAKKAAEKALSIDDTVAEAHTSLGFVKTRFDWDWAGAEASFRRAIEVNPNYALAHQWYSNYLVSVGRYDEAIESAKRALDLDPLSLSTNSQMGWIYFFARQYDDGIKASRKALDLDPNVFTARRYYGLSLEQKRLYDQAIEQFEKARDLSGGSPVIVAALGHAYAVAGRRADAQKILDEFLNPPKGREASSYDIALLYAGLGDKEKAFEWLNKALDEKDYFLAYINADPRVDPLRTDPRFETLLQRLGLV